MASGCREASRRAPAARPVMPASSRRLCTSPPSPGTVTVLAAPHVHVDRVGNDIHVVGIGVPEILYCLERGPLGMQREPGTQLVTPAVHRAVLLKAVDALCVAASHYRPGTANRATAPSGVA